MTAPKVCKYPGCLEAPERTGKPGRPAEYCANPAHTYTAMWELNKKTRAKTEKAAAARSASATRPVSARTETLSGIVRRIEELVQEELPALVADAAELVGAIADPTSLAEEIAVVRRECDQRVTEAELARADAERQAEHAFAERDAATAAQELADGAAAEAIDARNDAAEELEEVRRDTRKKLIEMQQLLDAARRDQAIAERERDAATRTAEARIAEIGQLRSDLDAERRSAQQRIDEAHASHVAGMNAVRADADKVVADMRTQSAADIAAVRADAEKVRAELRHDLEAAHLELSSMRRTGEFVPIAPASGARKGFRAQ